MISPYYFDYAAATPLDDHVVAAMQPFWQDQFYNPSALYLAAKDVNKHIGDARAQVAKTLGAKTSEIIFTAGGTESDNLAIHGVMQQFPGSHVVTSAIEHEAVLQAATQYNHSIAKTDVSGRLLSADLKNVITDNTVLISAMHANNEIGSIQPMAAIKHLVAEIRHQRLLAGNTLPLYFHSDASQTANYLDIHVQRLGVDLLTVNGGKMYGPKQTGILYKSTGVRLKPQILGGGQEWGLRSGTENVPGIVGFAKALEIAQDHKKGESERVGRLQQIFLDQIAERLPQATINSRNSLPNFVHLTIPGIDNERLVMELDEQGIMCAMGSACSASNEEPSHVLMAMGMGESAIRSSVRFTMGKFTTEEAVTETVRKLVLSCQ